MPNDKTLAVDQAEKAFDDWYFGDKNRYTDIHYSDEERLKVIIAQAITSATAELTKDYEQRCHDLKILRQAMGCDGSDLQQLLAKWDVTQQKLSSAEAVLEPFAKMGWKFMIEPYAEKWPDDTKLVDDKTLVAHNFITIGQCRKAAQFLKSISSPASQDFVRVDHPVIKAMWMQLEVVYGPSHQLCKDYQTLLEPTLPTLEQVQGIYKETLPTQQKPTTEANMNL